MDRPLFLYGTLRDEDLLAAVIGHAVDRRNVATAVAPGYATIFYDHRVYPALVRAPGGQAPGLVMLGLARVDLALIDAYEGDEYRRVILPVLVEGEMHETNAYLPTLPVGAEGRPWTLEGWQQNHKAGILVEDGALRRLLRQRIGAARLN